MSSESSPYHEVGLSGHTARQQVKKRKYKLGFEWTGWAGPGMRHVWQPESRKQEVNMRCRKCGQPYFAVETKKCLGYE